MKNITISILASEQAGKCEKETEALPNHFFVYKGCTQRDVKF